MKRYCFLACLAAVAACKRIPQQQVCKGYYGEDIRPIVASKCAVPDCHGHNGLVNLADYDELKRMADNGKIRQYVFDLQMMPPADHTQLTTEEKDKIKCWLDNGAPQD